MIDGTRNGRLRIALRWLGGLAMGKWDAWAYRDIFLWQAELCAEAGLTIQAAVWAVAADMSRAAAWASHHGADEAELRVRAECPGD
jgi:hypothetical protein